MRQATGLRFVVSIVAFVLLVDSGVVRAQGIQAVNGDFKSLDSQLGGKRVEQLALACNYVDRIQAVVAILRSSAAIATATTGMPAWIVSTADSIPNFCNLTMAILSAKNLDGVLRAARMANGIVQGAAENSLDFIEDSVDLALTLDAFRSSKSSTIDKALNAGMYGRVLNYAFNIPGGYNLRRNTSLVAEIGMAGGRQAQLIADQKLNNTCVEMSQDGDRDILKKAEKDKDYLEMPNGLLLKDADLARILRKQQRSMAIINGGAQAQIRMLGQAILGMIAHVERRGADAIEVSGSIIRRIIDRESPYVAVGYDYSSERVKPELSPADAAIRFEANEMCKKHDAVTDKTNPNAKRDSDIARGRKCEEFKKKISLKPAFYKESPKGKVGVAVACAEANKNIYRLDLFTAINQHELANPYYHPLEVAGSVTVCGRNVNQDSVRIESLLTGSERTGMEADQSADGKYASGPYSDEEVKARDKARAEDETNDCLASASMRSVKAFNSIRGFGPSADNAFEADWKRLSGCKPKTQADVTRGRKDNEAVAYNQFSVDFSTVGKWKAYYNDKINNEISGHYKGVKDTAAARWFRGARPISGLTPPKNGYDGGTMWNRGEDDWNQPTENVRRLQTDLGLISLCNIPSYLKKLYRSDEQLKIINQEDGFKAQDLHNLVLRCGVEQEGTVDSYQDIFRKYVEEIASIKLAYSEAEADVFQANVKFGSFVGSSGIRKEVECNSMRSVEATSILTANILSGLYQTTLDIYSRQTLAEMAKNDEEIKKLQALSDQEIQDILQANQAKRTSSPILLNNDESQESKLPPIKVDENKDREFMRRYGPKP